MFYYFNTQWIYFDTVDYYFMVRMGYYVDLLDLSSLLYGRSWNNSLPLPYFRFYFTTYKTTPTSIFTYQL
jgi:hypothetical protein